MKENSIEEDMKILKEIIKGDEDCINAIYSQMKVKNDNDEDIQYFKKEIQSIKNIVNNYLKEKARADKLEKEYSIMLSQLDEREINYKRVLKENEELKADNYELNNRINDLLDNISIQKVKDKIIYEADKLINLQFGIINELTDDLKKLNKVKIMRINDIRIPKEFQKPRIEKMKERIEYFKKNQNFETQIIVDKDNNLKDGYTSYLIAQKYEIDFVNVIKK